MNRREFILTAAAGPLAVRTQPPISIPLHHVLDSRARFRPGQIERFWSHIWAQAIEDLRRCGVTFTCSQKSGEIRRSPSGQPVFVGLEGGVINFVLTDRIPLAWDNGRGLTGITTFYRGYHLCVIAVARAHPHRVPFVAVNTCIHELLHVLLHDMFESRPKGLHGALREFRVDVYGTRLWLFHDGADIRKAAQLYLTRLTSVQGAASPGLPPGFG